MKRIIFTILATFTVISCVKEEHADQEKKDIIHTKIAEAANTKTSIYEGTQIVWSEGDRITAYMKSSQSTEYQIDPSAIGKTYGKFNIVSAENNEQDNGAEWKHNVGFYPYSIVTDCTRLSSYYIAEITLPTSQIYAENSFGNGYFPMVSVSNDNHFTFRNICGAIKLQLSGNLTVSDIEFTGNGEEKIAGPAIITASSDNSEPSIDMTSHADCSVFLDCGEGVTLNEDGITSFIITLPPMTFSNGFTVVVTDSDGEEYTLKTEKSNTVFRSSILVMPEIKLGETAAESYIDDEGVNHGPGVEIDGVIWAPVNCGYKAPGETDKGYPYGKLYQWGRKHGQGYTEEYDRDEPKRVKGPVSLLESFDEAYSNTFFTVSDSPHDWVDTPCETLWNAGTEDNPIKTEYDPCPKGWRIPTWTEAYALLDNSSPWSIVDGIQGRYVSGSTPYSNKVPNIFLSATGIRESNGNAAYRNTSNYYWTSRPAGKNEYYYFYAGITYIGSSVYAPVRGHAVRCVKDDKELIPVNQIEISEHSHTLYLKEELKLTAEVLPAEANNQFVHWSSDNSDIAHVDNDGIITALTPGTAVITAVAGFCFDQCTITVLDEYPQRDYIDEYSVNHGPGTKIGNTVWAPVNCGYKAPGETDKGYPYGKLYQWGRKYGQGYSEEYDATEAILVEGPVSLEVGQSEENANIFFVKKADGGDDWLDKSDNKLWNSGTETMPVKTSNDPCPEGWRVPTYTEMSDLKDNYSEWKEDNNGLPGACFGEIFLPAAGYRTSKGDTIGREFYGYYVTSDPKYGNGRYMRLTSSGASMMSFGSTKGQGNSVRCVQE